MGRSHLTTIVLIPKNIKESQSVRRHHYFTIVLCLLSVGNFGCWSKLPPGKVQIRGLVTVDDKPLTFDGDGIFSITLVAAGQSESAGAKLDKSSGTFTMVLSPGDYTAVIIATDGFGEEPRPGKVIAPKSLIPEKYSDLTTSGLTVTIPPRGGKVTIPLN